MLRTPQMMKKLWPTEIASYSEASWRVTYMYVDKHQISWQVFGPLKMQNIWRYRGLTPKVSLNLIKKFSFLCGSYWLSKESDPQEWSGAPDDGNDVAPTRYCSTYAKWVQDSISKYGKQPETERFHGIRLLLLANRWAIQGWDLARTRHRFRISTLLFIRSPELPRRTVGHR